MTTTNIDRLTNIWKTPADILGYLGAVNHKQVGVRYIVTAFFFFLIAGADAMVIRTQLTVPENDLVGPETYNQLFTTHGTAMLFFFAVPILEGIAIYFVPLMIGARDMPFPRLNAFAYWTFLFGGGLFYSSVLPDPVNFFIRGEILPKLVPDIGWYAYPPLTLPQYSPDINTDFYLLGITLVEIGALSAAVELITLIFKFRAPGMSLNRMPLFVWGTLVTAFMIIFAFPPLIAATALVELERKLGLPFYSPEAGGEPILWQHLFWIFGHPEVYIILLPAVGIVSMVVPVFSRRPIVGYLLVAASTVAIGFLSFGVWVHHMYTVGLLLIPLGFMAAASMAIAIPSGVQ